MNASIQDKPEYSTSYDSSVALNFFKLFGKTESAKEREIIFVQGKKKGFLSLQTNKIFFLVDGKVSILKSSGNQIYLLPGEIFGEFTPYTSSDNTAAVEESCKLITLTEKQLLSGLKKMPEFVFMLMDFLVRNLRNADTQETKSSQLPIINSDSVLSSKMLKALRQKLGESALTLVPEQRIIFREGASATLMYVIIDGYLITKIGDTIVRQSGPGGIIGEIALVDQKPRTASVVAETQCVLLAINRKTLVYLIQTLPEFGISLLRVLALRSNLLRSKGDYTCAANELGIECVESDWNGI